MEGIPVNNRRIATKPLSINLPDGAKVKSTHCCDIAIPGLPTILTGHIVPSLTIASLIGVRVLCDAGCTVNFRKNQCDIFFNNKCIMTGFKDKATDLWTLPIQAIQQQPTNKQLKQRVTLQATTHQPSKADTAHAASFAHSIRQRALKVRFAHQALCNPKISKLLKATRKGFLKGCPYISTEAILKYLNPSPATAKGYMKRPRQGIRSTTPKNVQSPPQISVPTPPPSFQEVPGYQNIHPLLPDHQRRNIIPDDGDASIANVFCFGAFADKHTGVVYNDMTGNFPFVSIDGSVCYFIMYHYESNSILATPIDGMMDQIIFDAYKKNFDMLEKKGFKVKMNVMDNQATKYIKKFLTEKECELQLVEPHNKRMNAAERAIQTWKDAFIAALATTDVDFPLQLWDRLTSQVQDCVNLMRASRINPEISAYEALNGPYDWNRYPLAPLGCKAVIYEDNDVRRSWASRGVDGWYLGPSKDHYRCDLYYIPETRAYRVSGSTELFPQHCQLPNLTHIQHLRALSKEIADETEIATKTPQGRAIIEQLKVNLQNILNPEDDHSEKQRVRREEEQRVIDNSPIITIPRITKADPILQSRNPTAKRLLKNTQRIHGRATRNNTPGGLPQITRAIPNANPHGFGPYNSNDPVLIMSMTSPPRPPPTTYNSIPNGAQSKLVSKQAINVLTIMEQATADTIFTPRRLQPIKREMCTPNMKHYANPIVHPVTGHTISSYKKAIQDPCLKEVWQKAFGKEFGGLAQGDTKTGTTGTNAIFVMTHDDIKRLKGKKYTYARIVMDHRPQKADPNRIRITAGGNLIHYDGDVSVRSADITTAKLHWNSVISTRDARYMCLDISLFYLTAALEYYEYMKMPLNLFPAWIVEQYNLKQHAQDGMVHIEMRKAVYGLPQAGILANKELRRRLKPHGYFEHDNTPGLWYHKTRPISFTLVVDDFGVKYVGVEHVHHLISCLKSNKYKLTEDWTGGLYCGIALKWNYDAKYVDISMPGYIKKKLQEYGHVYQDRVQTCPYSPEPKAYGTKAQAPLPIDDSPPSTKRVSGGYNKSLEAFYTTPEQST